MLSSDDRFAIFFKVFSIFFTNHLLSQAPTTKILDLRRLASLAVSLQVFSKILLGWIFGIGANESDIIFSN